MHYAVRFNSIKTVKAQYFHEIPKISIELSYLLLYYILLQFKEFFPLSYLKTTKLLIFFFKPVIRSLILRTPFYQWLGCGVKTVTLNAETASGYEAVVVPTWQSKCEISCGNSNCTRFDFSGKCNIMHDCIS